jgi:hypothetical protein
MLRQPLTFAAGEYLKEPRVTDPFMVPLINAWYKGDRAIFGRLDAMNEPTRNQGIVRALKENLGTDPVMRLVKARMARRHRDERVAVRGE